MAASAGTFDALASSENLDKEDAQTLGIFLRDLTAQDMLDVQASYSELFDRGRATSLLLFEHVHGESRDRGQAMVDLMAQYEQHGLQLDSRELPDHLPLYLEYLAQLPKSEALGGYRISRRFWRCSALACNSVKVVMRCCSICC